MLYLSMFTAMRRNDIRNLRLFSECVRTTLEYMIIMLEICKAALGVLCHVSNSNVMSAKPHHKQQPFSCRHEKNMPRKTSE